MQRKIMNGIVHCGGCARRFYLIFSVIIINFIEIKIYKYVLYFINNRSKFYIVSCQTNYSNYPSLLNYMHLRKWVFHIMYCILLFYINFCRYFTSKIQRVCIKYCKKKTYYFNKTIYTKLKLHFFFVHYLRKNWVSKFFNFKREINFRAF